MLQNKLGNAILRPMPGTLYSLPWAADGKHRVGEVLCETFWIKPFRNGEPQNACPRYVARRQLDRLEALGYQLFSGFEAEFVMCNSAGQPVYKGQSCFLNKRLAEYESFIYSMDEKVASAGINVATFQTEHGDGQFELVMAPKYGIKSADQMFKFKEAIKEMSQQHDGWQATFMSKPFIDSLGNGHHYSHSLWSSSASNVEEDGSVSLENAFYDPNAENCLSTVARQWLAGLIRHASALTALCSPTVNCYRRLHTPWSPDFSDWGLDDRTAAFRVKTGHQEATYIENRIPGGSSNPYLVLAATVAAGIDGIVNKLECPAPKSDSSMFSFAKLPESLPEALEALENDDVMRESLGEEAIRWFVETKRQSEISKISQIITDTGRADIEVEREFYFCL